jgi:AraC family transcriptional regulator, regulatory protein of adaptative response / methylated-DNA-[protein]-cysteine methyltransferase
MTSPNYDTDDARWHAMRDRDPAAEGRFFAAVRTTGVYCRPSCSARPLRRNVGFFDTAEAARAAGFRACKRCKPDEPRETLRYATRRSDLGLVLAAVSGKGLCAVTLGEEAAALTADLARRFPRTVLLEDPQALAKTLDAVVAVMAGGRSALAIDERGSELQRQVWRALRDIPAGRTASYAEVARSIGRPTAARAVAQACGANPLAVVTPCHRVLRADGGLSGYRWGVQRKAALLAREARA